MIDYVQVLDRQTFEEARSLIACASLQSIRFAKFSFSVDIAQGDAGEEVELSTTRKSAALKIEGGMILSFDLSVRGKKDGRTTISVNGKIEALYELPPDHEPSASQMKAFARTNGMLNVWPYWREYVQSATLRAGLPPLTLPLFRVLRKPNR